MVVGRGGLKDDNYSLAWGYAASSNTATASGTLTLSPGAMASATGSRSPGDNPSNPGSSAVTPSVTATISATRYGSYTVTSSITPTRITPTPSATGSLSPPGRNPALQRGKAPNL